ncbi:MAG: aminoglycoside phosphotransferase family protein [Acidimicrobiia bacterium]|nr:aminoglycoside phosphotransferase family protein [Acidimicrobiia bacterium]
MSDPTVSPTLDEAAVVATLSRHAPAWLDSPEPGSAVVHRVEQRTQSTLIWADIMSGGDRRPVVVKIPLPPRPSAATTGFRLFEPVVDPVEKSGFEYATLAAVDRVVGARGDDRFGRIRAYGHLPELAAVVVGVAPGRTLDRALRRGRRGGPGDERRVELMHRSGALLQLFHSATTDHMVTRSTTADEVVAEVENLFRHIEGSGRGRRLAPRIESIANRFAAPSGWPAEPVMGHGDFAPRNIFVDDELRVTTIDSLGRFRIPPQEDVSYLLVELSTGSTRFSSPGMPWSAAWVDRLRRSFLAGYPMADDPVLWLFELRALLDKWRSLVDRRNNRTTSVVLRDGVRQALLEREVARVADRLERTL